MRPDPYKYKFNPYKHKFTYFLICVWIKIYWSKYVQTPLRWCRYKIDDLTNPKNEGDAPNSIE